jgi:RND family efflux transporter MFP subunit
MKANQRKFPTKKRIVRLVGLLLVALIISRITGDKPLPVIAAEAQQATVIRAISATGRIRAVDTVAVRSLVAGRIVKLAKDDGDTVKAGEVIAKIDSDIAQQSLKQVKSQLSIEIENFNQRTRELKRAQALLKTKAIAPQAFEEAQLAERQSRDNVERLKAQAAESERSLKEFTITAPLDGVVRTRLVDVGQAVGLETNLFEIVTNSQQEIECEIDEVFINRLKLAQEVTWRPSGINVASQKGSISYISPTVDPRTGGVIVRMALDGETGLKPGQSADVNFVVEKLDDVISIPRRSLINEDGKLFVWKAVNGKATKSEVTINEWPDGDLVITSGVAKGELIILPREPLTVGQNIKVKN